MNKINILALLPIFFLLGAGCQKQAQTRVISLPAAVDELQTQTVPEIEKQEKSEVKAQAKQKEVGTILYKGSWFDIKYPENFTASPTASTNVYNGQKYVQTDEATFTSPDGTVEFFVYSPLWSGNPETYLTISEKEEVVSEKNEEVKESERSGALGDRIVRWVTVKAKDGSYYRSFVSINEQVGTGSDVHHVFGIKYKDNASYEKYRDSYVAFKESLQQYAD